MKAVLAAIVLTLGVCAICAAQDETEYVDNYRKALRLSGNDRSAGALSCKSGDDKIGFFAELSPYASDRETVGENVAEDMIFRVYYYLKNEKSGKLTRYFEEDIGVLSVDSDASFRFSFVDSPKIVRFELSDPKMKPIVLGKTPIATRIEKLDRRDDVYAINIVKLWENDATDKAISCDLRVQTVHLSK
ncbi:MAG: hypothetical protein LBO72_02830 [Helicobacteraceae bacterium]|jgi:hypothetical protein|nr:hypothetical protein [Helicobacteraceae bacterium]